LGNETRFLRPPGQEAPGAWNICAFFALGPQILASDRPVSLTGAHKLSSFSSQISCGSPKDYLRLSGRVCPDLLTIDTSWPCVVFRLVAIRRAARFFHLIPSPENLLLRLGGPRLSRRSVFREGCTVRVRSAEFVLGNRLLPLRHSLPRRRETLRRAGFSLIKPSLP